MNRQFTALGGIAIILVVLNHSISMGTLFPSELGYPQAQGFGRWVLLVLQGLGVFAIPTFLLISGGFVAYAARGNPPKFTWKAVRSTFSRLFWPYIFWSLLFYFVVYVLRDETSTFMGVANKLLIGYPYHFVPLLMINYFVSPILIPIAKRWGLLTIIVILSIQLVLLNLGSPGILGFEFPGWVRTIVPRYYNSVFAYWGIYFPMGIVCVLNAKDVIPQVRKLRWLIFLVLLVFFVTYIFVGAEVVIFPLAQHICPLAFFFLCLIIKRESIPMVRIFERIGKQSYAIYLIHLIVLWLTVYLVKYFSPWLLESQWMLQPVLFLLALGLPLLLLKTAASLPIGRTYRYFFG